METDSDGDGDCVINDVVVTILNQIISKYTKVHKFLILLLILYYT